MEYKKPQISILGPAVTVVKGMKQQDTVSDGTPGYKTLAAYQADE
jgi:hypothetical protein